jgi:hypothetical protein
MFHTNVCIGVKSVRGCALDSFDSTRNELVDYLSEQCRLIGTLHGVSYSRCALWLVLTAVNIVTKLYTIQRSILYRPVYTLRLGYKNQPVNAV